jgi:hypothetical protein
MSDSSAAAPLRDAIVPDEVIPHGDLPPLTYREMPEPLPMRRMVGPGIILAGLALGSGEFILWPYITYKSQFVFFWACVLGVATQYVINMEITRWTLATGESAITGFCRLSKHWAWFLLLCNVIPWMIPAWANGAAEILAWLIWTPQQVVAADGTSSFAFPGADYVTPIAIAGMVLCGAILTAGPVIYNTVERIQAVLVGLVLVLVLILAWMVIRPDAVVAMATATATFGHGQFFPASDTSFTAPLDAMTLLGALAFAGAGGTLNLGQSNYVKDKGYGMGAHIGRITSPITGQAEPVAEIGYHFPHTAENLARWRRWWSLASREHFVSFFLTCLVCLVLLTLISYSLFYGADGELKPGAEKYGNGMQFVLGEGFEIDRLVGGAARLLFLVMGIAILLTTEFGVLDAASRISADIVKVNWLRGSPHWSEGRLYYVFLWGTILFGSLLLLAGDAIERVNALGYIKLAAALNGGIMFIYSFTLLQLNRRVLPAPLRMSGWRVAGMVWSVLFFGSFTAMAGWSLLGW